jgi:hypothetical protein
MFCFCAVTRAEGVLDVVPADAWVVVRINRLEETNKKAAAWAEAMGLAQLSPEAADPLGALERHLNLQGIDKSKDMAFVVLDPTAAGGDQEKSLLILVPTTDYKALSSSLPNAKTAGNITTFTPEGDGEEPGYAAQWGDYAALSPVQALVTKKAAGLKVTGLAAKELQEKDAVVYFNIPAMRSKLLPELRKAREQLKQEMQRQAGANAPDADAAPAGDTGAAPAARPAQPRPGQRPATPPPAGNRQGAGERPESRGDSVDANTQLVALQNQPQPGRRPQPNPRPQPTRRPPPPPAEVEGTDDGNDADQPAPHAAPGHDPAAAMKAYMPALSALMDQYFNLAERFLTDTNAATIGLQLNDAGLNTTATAEFTPDSYLGGIAKGIKNSDAALLTGLPPERRYFAFGGAINSPEVGTKIITDMADPVLKHLAGAGEGGQVVTEIIQALKTAIQNTKTTTIGYPAPTGALGADSIIQSVAISTGNAKQIHAAQKQLLQAMTKLMHNMQALAGAAGPKMNFEIQEGARTVGNAKLDQYKFNMEMDAENDPAAAQAQQVMAMIYGPNGQSGVLGAISDNVFIAIQGGNDKLVQEVVAAAQNPQDKLSGTGSIKAVSANLPKNRAGVFYIQLDQIVTTGVQYAQGFGLPVKMQLPKGLPPIGVSFGSESTAVRVDSHVPTSLVQSIVAAGMQAAMQMQGGGGAPDGAPEGL